MIKTNEIICQLPLHLSKTIFNNWIEAKDICHIDQAYLNEINRNKVNVILNNLLIFGLENVIVDDFYDSKLVKQRQNLYLNWLIAKNIQVKYFSNQKLSIDNIYNNHNSINSKIFII